MFPVSADLWALTVHNAGFHPVWKSFMFTRLDVLGFIHGETEESVLTSVPYFVIVEMKHAAVAMKKYWWLLTHLLSVVCLTSYLTTTFMIEAMAAANAQLRWKRREQVEVRQQEEVSFANICLWMDGSCSYDIIWNCGPLPTCSSIMLWFSLEQGFVHVKCRALAFCFSPTAELIFLNARGFPLEELWAGGR